MKRSWGWLRNSTSTCGIRAYHNENNHYLKTRFGMSQFFVKISVKFRLLDKADMTFHTDYWSVEKLAIFFGILPKYWHFYWFFRKFPDISGSQTPPASSQRALGQPVLQSTRPSISIFHMRQAQISIVFSLSANAKIRTQAKRLGFKLGYHWAVFSFVNIYT